MADVQRTTEPLFNELLATGATPTERTDVAALPTRVEEFRRVLSSLDDALQCLSRVVAKASPGVTDYYSEALEMLDARCYGHAIERPARRPGNQRRACPPDGRLDAYLVASDALSALEGEGGSGERPLKRS